MMKFILVLVLAVVACQGTQAASIEHGNQRGIEEAIQIITELTENVEQLVTDIAFHFQQLIQDLINSIQKTEIEVGILEVINEVNAIIEKYIADGGIQAKHCAENAWNQIGLTVQETQNDASKCVSTSKMTIPLLQTQMQVLLGHANNLIADMALAVQACINENGSYIEGIIKCVRKEVSGLQNRIDNLEKEIKETMDKMKEIIREDLINLNTCLTKVKSELLLKTNSVLAELRTCVGITQSRTITAHSPNRGLTDIMKFIQSIISEVQDMMKDWPNITDIITKKIRETIAHFNIKSLAKQLKAEIAKLLDEAGDAGKKCVDPANKNVNNLIQRAEAESAMCLSNANTQVQEIDVIKDNLVDKATNIKDDILNIILNCTQLNPVGFAKCLEKEIQPIIQKVSTLHNDVLNGVSEVKTIAKEVLSDLATCVNSNQINTINEGQIVIKDVEKCVHTSG